ncbi:glycosyltransferase family 2 protein [Klenkia brasiliensis]|uniref:Glycosyltransferase involved in cell wall bisynthesis n=1 Tax=Klenkia brasiliensis TaxID=333142 RepID=A0A1G7MXI8_9ACTN|nr:glycosyltransferase family 2 protein [Klenkia brasiliensis]SDF65770.1 Glycosyltransferase involved in cell wall bisynthesis [Klenkia brasiliensis]
MHSPPVLDRPPLVTVVVAALDAESFISRTLDSVRAQTYDRWECVVVDDGSTDATADLVRAAADEDPRIRLVQQENRGTPVARNAGIAAASPGSEFLAFLDADDLWTPDALAVLVGSLQGDGSAVSSYGLAEYIDERDEVLDGGRHPAAQRDRRVMGRLDLVDLPVDEPYTHDAMLVSGTLWPAGVALHRRSVVTGVGGFDPFFRQIQDWDLYLRMTRQGHMVPVDRVVAGYRQHPANVTKRSGRVALYSQWARWKAAHAAENTPAQLRTTRRVWRRLTLRWLLWAVQAAVGHLRRPDPAGLLRALRACVLFARALALGTPVRPTDQWVRAYTEVVADRQFGSRPGA